MLAAEISAHSNRPLWLLDFLQSNYVRAKSFFTGIRRNGCQKSVEGIIVPLNRALGSAVPLRLGSSVEEIVSRKWSLVETL